MQFSHGFYIKVLAASQDQFIFLRFVFFISEMDKMFLNQTRHLGEVPIERKKRGKMHYPAIL